MLSGLPPLPVISTWKDKLGSALHVSVLQTPRPLWIKRAPDRVPLEFYQNGVCHSTPTNRRLLPETPSSARQHQGVRGPGVVWLVRVLQQRGESWNKAPVDISSKLWVSWRTGTRTFLIIQLRVPPGPLVSGVLDSYYKVTSSSLKKKKILFFSPLSETEVF